MAFQIGRPLMLHKHKNDVDEVEDALIEHPCMEVLVSN